MRTSKRPSRTRLSPGPAPSPTRSRAVLKALKKEPRTAATHEALARQARASAAKRGPASLRRAAKKAVATKGPSARRRAALKAARTRARK
jgi:hypothetical protein